MQPTSMQIVEEEFQFLLCEKCQKEARNPKLLSCLHTLCSDCIGENKPIGLCPICRAPILDANGIPDQDNLLFANLQAKLHTFRKIVTGNDLVCSNDRCKKSAEFWCSDCEALLCAQCFEAHQFFFKKNHEARKVTDLKMESAKQFLEGAKKSSNLFCSSASHQNKGEITSIYCQGCEKPLCCSCAFLDREHTNLCCDIHLEIQRRQEELGSMSTELQGKKKHYEDAYNHLQGQANHLEQVKKETKELIQQKVAEMLQLVQQQGEELQTMVENRHQLERQDIEGKLQHMEAVLKRMASSERLVEKMYLYASEQEVMDMHPFIRKSLAGLKKEQPPAVGARVQAGDMAECKAKLQAMYERVTGKKDAASRAAPATSALAALPAREVVSKNELPPSIASPTKRRLDQTEKAMQTLPKVLKLEANDDKMSRTASKEEQDNTVWSQQPGASTSTPRRDSAGATAKRVDLSVEQMSTCSESCEPEEPTIVLSSSEETDDDTMLSGMPGARECSSTLWLDGSMQGSKAGSENGLWEYGEGNSTLVFFDMKVEKATQRITQLAAVNGEHSFKTIIHPSESVLNLFSEGDTLEKGLEDLLCYLHYVHKPILVVYNTWSRELPILFKALDSLAKKQDFCTAVVGYLDTVSVIKDKVPRASLYKLKKVVRICLQKSLNESSALASAKALRDLCEYLEVHMEQDPRPALSHCNLECYTALQPLLQERLLTKSAAKILAMRNMILYELQPLEKEKVRRGGNSS